MSSRALTVRQPWRLSLYWLVIGSGIFACSIHGHHISFSPLEDADRIEIRTLDETLVKTVRDPAQIRYAVDFIKRYQSGWKDPWRGPLPPAFKLTFFKGQRGLSGFGVGAGYIVADQPTAGFWSREVPSEDIIRLLQALMLNEALLKIK